MDNNNTASIVRNDVQTSTVEVITTTKPYKKMNGVKQTETNNETNEINEQENETNSGHSSSNESNNIDKRKKGTI